MSIDNHTFNDLDILSANKASDGVLNLVLDTENLIAVDGSYIEIHKEDAKAIAIHFGLIKKGK